MASKRKKCWISKIEPIEEDGFYQASLDLIDHAECIAVIGANIDECAERALRIRDAFNV